MTIAQLADRLEAGLAQLKALHGVETDATSAAVPPIVETESISMPPLRSVEPAQPDAQSARQADMDAALKAALGTLERMTAQR